MALKSFYNLKVVPVNLGHCSSRVPVGGFANLVEASGLTKFSIADLDYSPNRLHMASTWYGIMNIRLQVSCA